MLKADCAKKNQWLAFVPEYAKDSSGQEFMRPRGRSVVYRIVSEDAEGNETYTCNDCGSRIISATVAHPVWDGPSSFKGSGGGSCQYEQVPYCSKCEKKPTGSGIPIRVPFQF
ncbi:MAG: hypothetical protein KKD75_01745 [Nanoarchaeota archaeon]|nr:hypothetical protein [Nanoarchaeota archaeon]MBU1632594.1 hypothetical protein [Nanoarchaeota archaeon]MBU1876115.1 hypothetical protein [Nanoarchaeota archaeon]